MGEKEKPSTLKKCKNPFLCFYLFSKLKKKKNPFYSSKFMHHIHHKSKDKNTYIILFFKKANLKILFLTLRSAGLLLLIGSLAL